MASSSLTFFPSLHPQFQPTTSRSSPGSSLHSISRIALRPIRAAVSQNPSTAVQPSESRAGRSSLPIREIPGDYGLPVIGPMRDRLDFFYNQGRDEFFRSRVKKYKSTVFRVNMPPGNFIAENPNVIVLLDGKSFPVLFDLTKVDKRNLFTGTYMPSTELTGGYRMLSYLDPSEPKHAKLKKFLFYVLKRSSGLVLTEFHNSYSELFDCLESALGSQGKADFGEPGEQAAFAFLTRSLFGVRPEDTQLGADAPKLIGKWVLMNLHPLISLGLPKLIEEALLHSFRLPPFLVKSDYKRLYDFFYRASSGEILDEAERLGISRDEACHNLVFATCFNSFGGIKILFSNILKMIGRSGVQLHNQIAREIRSAIKANGGKVTMAAMEQMPLTKSVVYETLRIEPPVQSQYGIAKREFVLESHDAAFRVKAGETLFGFQPFATRDPLIFDRPDEFVADRFVGEEGERLLKHVVWSNGPETESPTTENKQCAGKDFVVLVARLFLIELFSRYDSFEIEVGEAPLGSSITITSLKRASFS